MAYSRAQIVAANYSYQGPIPGTVVSTVLSLPGTTNATASVADDNSFDVTGDIDVRIKIAADDWTPADIQYLVSRHGGGLSTNDSWGLQLRTDGTLKLRWTEGTTLRQADSSALGLTDGQAKWLRVTLDVDNGASGCDVKFYTSDDGASWSQHGSTVTQAFTTSVNAGTYDLYVGSNGLSSALFAAGDVSNVQVLDGIAGSAVIDIDFTSQTVGATSFTCGTGQTVTINGDAEIVAA